MTENQIYATLAIGVALAIIALRNGIDVLAPFRGWSIPSWSWRRTAWSNTATNTTVGTPTVARYSILGLLSFGVKFLVLLIVVLAIITVAVNYEYLRDLVIPPAPPVPGTDAPPPRQPILFWKSPYLTGLSEVLGVGHLVMVLSLLFAGLAIGTLIYWIAIWLWGSSSGLIRRVSVSTNMVIATLAVAIIVVMMMYLFPHFTTSVRATLPDAVLIAAIVATILVLGMMQGAARWGLAALLGFFVLYVIVSVPACAPGDDVCRRAQHAAEVEAASKKAARIADRQRVQMGPPAQSAQCPGVAPKFDDPPEILTTEWRDINPNGCDLYYAFRGQIQLSDKNKSNVYEPIPTGVGKTADLTHRYVRAKNGTAEFYYILCPKALGPTNGGWECRPTNSLPVITQWGVGLGLLK